MQTIGLKDLKTNPAILTKAIANKEYLLISKRGKPIAVTASLDEQVLDVGLRNALLFKAFADGGLSLGQLTKALDKSYEETMKLLSLMGIPVLDYDLADELATLDSFV